MSPTTVGILLLGWEIDKRGDTREASTGARTRGCFEVFGLEGATAWVVR